MTEEKENDLKDQLGSENDTEKSKKQKPPYDKAIIVNDLLYIIYDVKKNLSDIAIDDMLIAIGWHWTECKDSNKPLAKLRGCTYWSEEAFKYAYGNDLIRLRDPETNKYKSDSELRHEHVVPKKVFRESIKRKMYDNEKSRDEFKADLENALEKYFACVVTDKQAEKLDEYKDKMPSSENNDIFTIRNPWARYVEVNKKYLEKESTDKESIDMGLTDIWKIYWRRQGRGWVPIGIEEGKIDDKGWQPTGVKRGDTETT